MTRASCPSQPTRFQPGYSTVATVRASGTSSEAADGFRVGYRDQVDALGQPKERGDTTVEWTRPAERDGVQA